MNKKVQDVCHKYQDIHDQGFPGSGGNSSEGATGGSGNYCDPDDPQYNKHILGTSDYLKDLDNYSATEALKKIMSDVYAYGDTSRISDVNWKELCLKINDLVSLSKVFDNLGSKTGEAFEFAKAVHYFRNKLNRSPKTLDEMIALIQNGGAWNLNDPLTAIYHMYDIEDSDEGIFNLKFVSRDGLFEAVYDRSGNLVTDATNMGTYNYGDFFNHSRLDVDPYKIFGNAENFVFPGKEWDNYTRFLANYDAWIHYNNVVLQIDPDAYHYY